MDTFGRDRGLNRLAKITRWSVGGAVALTGVFSALVAHSRPGQSTASSSSGSSSSSNTPATGGTFLQPPNQVPTGGFGGGIVRSGAT